MKAFIFDMDGTLLNSMHIWTNIDLQFLRRHDRVPSPSLLKEIAILTLDECATYFREHYALPMTNEQIIAEWKEMIGFAYHETIEAKPGAIEFVRKCAAEGKPLCVATSASRANAEAAVKRLQIASCFSFIKTSDEVGKGKNFPDIYMQCAEQLGVSPDECVVIEDSIHAARTARSAGFAVWGIYDETSAADWAELQNICTFTFRSFEELL